MSIEAGWHSLARPRLEGEKWRASLGRMLIVTRREVRDSLRDWRITGPILILTAVFPWLTGSASRLAAQFAVNYGVADNATIILQQLIPFSLLIVGFFPISFSLVIALETFVGERERNTLEPLLATPISDRELYLAKLAGVMVLPLVASYLGLFIHLINLQLTTDYRVPLVAVVQVLLLTTLEALVMVSGAVVVSAHTTSVRAANLLASFIIIPVALLLQAEAVLLFWGRYHVLWVVALGLVAMSIALLRAGMRLFNREEILAREFDEFSLRSLWRRFLSSWSALPGETLPATPRPLPGLVQLYREHLPRLFRLYSRPLVLVTAFMVGSLILGWAAALRYPLPPNLFNPGHPPPDLAPTASGWPQLDLLPRLTVSGIFMHNMRVLLLGAALSLISFGAGSLLLLLLPLGVTGFLAGQVSLGGRDPLLFMLAAVMPHGWAELPAAALASAFALQLGASLMAPPRDLSLGEGLMLALVNFLKVFLLVVLPLLLLAAILEVYVTPQTALWWLVSNSP